MLTKQPKYVFVLGRPGQPYIADREVCIPPLPPPPPYSYGTGGGNGGSGGGSGNVVCTVTCVPIGDGEVICGMPVCRAAGG